MTETFYEILRRQGISRRSFVKFCSLTATSLGSARPSCRASPTRFETKPRTPVIWLHGLECTCCTESLHPLGASAGQGRDPVDDLARLRRHADGRGGHQAEAALEDAREVQGQLHPRRRRQPAAERRRHVLHPGGRPSSRCSRSRRRRQGRDRLGFLRFVGLRAGCQAQPDPGDADRQGDHRQAHHQGAGLPADRRGDDRRGHLHADLRPDPRTRPPGTAEDVLRPAHPRQVLPAAHFDAGQFVENWDDEGARKGYCLYKMGCKGPTTYNACSTVRWNNGVSFPIQSGPWLHRLLRRGLLGQRRLLQPPHDINQFGIEANADKVGGAAAGVAGAARRGAYRGHRVARARKRRSES